MGRGGIEKVLEYLEDYLPAPFTHPLKTMEDCDMFSFLRGVLQVYLEFWNSSKREIKMSKRCQIVKKMSNCQKDVKCQKVKQIDYGGGSQKNKLT